MSRTILLALVVALLSSGSALAGPATPGKGLSFGHSIQEAIAGVYASVSPAQITLISAFLNSPSQPDALTFRQQLIRTANLPKAPNASDSMESAANERFVQLAQSDDLAEGNFALIATRLHSLHSVLDSRRIIPPARLKVLEDASSLAEGRLSDVVRVRVLLKVARISKNLYPPAEPEEPVISDVGHASEPTPAMWGLQAAAKHETAGELKINGITEDDSLKSQSWRKYLDVKNLLNAWLPPATSPYRRFVKTKTIESVAVVGGRIKPRYGSGELHSREGVSNLVKSGRLGKNTAVILASAGPFNIAMAADLVEHGYQPVVMVDDVVHRNFSNNSVNDLASFLFFAEELHLLQSAGKIAADAPPVFILGNAPVPSAIRPQFISEDAESGTHVFPSAAEFEALGITQIVYLNQGDQDGEFYESFQSPDRMAGNKDLQKAAALWVKAGIKLFYTGVEPHPRSHKPGFY